MRAYLLCLLVCLGSMGPLAARYVYEAPPENFRPRLEVAGCYCRCEERVLFMLRNPERPQGNTWCKPGGKLEQGETPRQAIVREVWEEAGLVLPQESLEYCRPVYVRFPNVDFVLHLFKAHLEGIPSRLEIDLSEHQDYRWVTLDEALRLDLIPGESECIALVYPDVASETHVYDGTGQ